ncbi:MAG: YdeI/OmpD-associated family protein [Anaerolineales bacterium]|nr:YdeI/OmpD-associated family protein [Anaerolineales bacterium]
MTIEEDAEPGVVEAPQDIQQAFQQQADAQAIFQRLSYTHQKEYVNWIWRPSVSQRGASGLTKQSRC